MASELVDKGIRKAIRTVRRRRILDRAVEVIRHCKGERIEELSDRMKVTGKATLYIGGGPTEFTEASQGHYHDRLHVEIHYGGSLMFSATRGPHEIADGVDRRRVIREAHGSVVVDTFRVGLWMQLLSVKRLVRQAQLREKREERERKARLRPAKPEPVCEEDYAMISRFVIR